MRLRIKNLRRLFSDYGGHEGTSEELHEFVKVQIAANFGRSNLKMFEDTAFSSKVKGETRYFLPAGQGEQLAQQFTE